MSRFRSADQGAWRFDFLIGGFDVLGSPGKVLDDR
jgi:hypothetical protein